MSVDQNDYNKSGLYTFMFCMVFSCVFFIYIAFFSGGIDLKEVKQMQEKAAATNTLAGGSGENKIDPATLKEPWVATPEVIAYGKEVFATNCALCHGPEGKGDGPAGASLNPKPRNFVEGKWKTAGTSLALFDVLQHGLKGSAMASFAHLSATDRWSAIAFVRSITKNKVANNESELKAKAPSLK